MYTCFSLCYRFPSNRSDKSPSEECLSISGTILTSVGRQLAWALRAPGGGDILREAPNHVSRRPVVGHHHQFPVRTARSSYPDFPASSPDNLCKVTLGWNIKLMQFKTRSLKSFKDTDAFIYLYINEWKSINLTLNCWSIDSTVTWPLKNILIEQSYWDSICWWPIVMNPFMMLANHNVIPYDVDQSLFDLIWCWPIILRSHMMLTNHNVIPYDSSQSLYEGPLMVETNDNVILYI